MTMSKDPEFLILKHAVGWLPEKDWKSLLGAAAKNPWSPLTDSVPTEPLSFNNERLVETEFEGFILHNDFVSSISHELKVEGFGELRYNKKVEERIDLKGKLIYVKRLRQVGQDTEIATLAENVGERQARNEMPLGTVAKAVAASHGVPLSTGGIGNAVLDKASTTVERTYFAAAGKDKHVFALELKMIDLKDGKPKLTDKAPNVEPNRQLGGDDENDVFDFNDLIAKDLSEEDWDELLNKRSD